MIDQMLPLVTTIPFAAFAFLALSLMFGWKPPEKLVNCLVAGTMLTHFLLLSVIMTKVLFHWTESDFRYQGHGLTLELFLDHISAPLLWSSSFICAVVGFFSARYLHRDPGFYRFFTLFLLFVSSVSLALTAVRLELLVVGWELVGITSVLLIGFFQFRPAPPQASLYAWTTYRLCDAALLGGVLLLGGWCFQHGVHVELTNLSDLAKDTSGVALIGSLLVIGCLGKSAQLPFSSWLPRAMEGPTPSSAVFYGAVSAHMGVFLLLRLSPVWRLVPALPPLVVTLGLSTALYAAFCGRTRSDAKSQLAFAAMAQLGLIFSEIGLGFEGLAILHMVGHSMVRTLQFLKAPSLLHEFHQMGASGKRFFRNSLFTLEQVIPQNIQTWLYRHALREVHLPSLIEKAIIQPFWSLFALLDRWEMKWSNWLEGKA